MDYEKMDRKCLIEELHRQVALRESVENELRRLKEHGYHEVPAFISEISFRFCSLMNSLNGMTDLIGIDTDLTPRQEYYIGMIRKSVKRLLQMAHDIRSFFDSENPGSDITVAGDAEKTVPTASVLVELKKLGNKNILIVEDDEISRLLLIDLIERNGWSVTSVENGLEALHALNNNDFDLILLDLQVPEIDGFELTRIIRENEKKTRRHIPIVAVTAHTIKGCRDKCLEVGMDEYIPKPMELAVLFEIMEKQLSNDREDSCMI